MSPVEASVQDRSDRDRTRKCSKKKVLVACYSRTGRTEQMAEGVAEGVRFSGNHPGLVKISDIKTAKDLQGFDGYCFGCPPYHRGMVENVKTLLFLAQKGNLAGKLGGAFGSSTHSGEAPGYIFDTMEHVFKMEMTNLGPFGLASGRHRSGRRRERARQDSGGALGKKLSQG